MLPNLVELLWFAGGAGLTVLLAVALWYWIRQESRARSTPPDATPPSAARPSDKHVGEQGHSVTDSER